MKDDILNKIEEYNKLTSQEEFKNDLISEYSSEKENIIMLIVITIFYFTFYFHLNDNFFKGMQAFFSYILFFLSSYIVHDSYLFYKRVFNNSKKIRTDEIENKTTGVILSLIAPFPFFIIIVYFTYLIDYFIDINSREWIINIFFSTWFIMICFSGFHYFKSYKKINAELKNNDKSDYDKIDVLETNIKNDIESIDLIEYYIAELEECVNNRTRLLMFNIRNKLIKEKGFKNIKEYKQAVVKNQELTISNN